MEAYTPFADFFKNTKVEIQEEIKTAVHADENIANNRLFVWNFEEVDLDEFLSYFKLYKDSVISASSRQRLSGSLSRKMGNLMREGYNPIECMLYASKLINAKLQNDNELQAILAERIKDVYLVQEEETILVLNNIIRMWTWTPQIKVVINAIGLIGDNQELLDSIVYNYADDRNYRLKVFYALIQNKSAANLERLLKIIMSLSDSEEDSIIGRMFKREIVQFGYEGKKLVEKYYENPGMSRAGARVFKKIIVQDETDSAKGPNDDLYRSTLANKSSKDDIAYEEFVADCQKNYDNNAFYLCRFSRAKIGEFLKQALEDESLNRQNRITAILSLGIAGEKGYKPAAAILETCEKKGDSIYAVTVANIFIGNRKYAERLVDMFCEKKDYQLNELYRILKGANIISYADAVRILQVEIERKFAQLLEQRDDQKLENLTSNFQMFWNNKLYSLLSKPVLDRMQDMLLNAAGTDEISESVMLSLIEVLVHSWNASVEKTFFVLYKTAKSVRVQGLSFQKLMERDIIAPK